MIDELARHGYELRAGTLYQVLHSLEAAGYLERQNRVVGGKVRNYYIATDHGRAALDDARSKIRELVDEVLEGGGPEHLPEPRVPREGGAHEAEQAHLTTAIVARGSEHVRLWRPAPWAGLDLS